MAGFPKLRPASRSIKASPCSASQEGVNLVRRSSYDERTYVVETFVDYLLGWVELATRNPFRNGLVELGDVVVDDDESEEPRVSTAYCSRKKRWGAPLKQERLRKDVDRVFDGVDVSLVARDGATDDDSSAV